jgi:iron complex outermembrane receptor protein
MRLKTQLPLIGAVLVLSQEVYSYNETDLYSPIPEVTSVSRIPQNVTDVPIATTVITQELIRASSATTVTELLRLVPGFQTYHVNANKEAVTYHGNSGEYPNRLEIRINGRPVYVPMLSTVAWSALGISIEDIQYIEVVRGSNVPAYGSNALIGAINIITRSAIQPEHTHISATVGSNQTRTINTAFSRQVGDTQVLFSATHDENAGFKKAGDGKDVNMANLTLTYTPNLFDTLTFSAGINHGKIVIGSGDPSEPYLYMDRDQTSHFEQVTWQRTLSENQEFEATFYNNYLKLSTPTALASEYLGDPDLVGLNTQIQTLAALWPYLNLPWGDRYPFDTTSVSDMTIWPIGEDGVARTTGTEIQYSNSERDNLTWVIGAGFRRDTLESEAMLGQKEEISEETASLFTHTQWQFMDNWSMNMGTMFEHASLTDQSTVSSRLGLTYQLTPTFTLRAAATQAYRSPSILELKGQAIYQFPEGIIFDYNRYANEQLDPEKLRSQEIGFIWQMPMWQSYLDVKLYRERITKGIGTYFVDSDLDLSSIYQYLEDTSNGRSDPRPYDEVGYSANRTTSLSKGIDIEWTANPTRNDLIHLAYSYTDLSGIQEGGVKKSHILDTRAPRHTLSLLYNRRLNEHLDASLVYNYLSDVDWLDAPSAYNYKTVDAQIRLTTKMLANQTLTTKILVKNLFDYNFVEFEENNRYGREVYLTFSMDF